MSWLVLNSYGWSVLSVFLFSSIQICAFIRANNMPSAEANYLQIYMGENTGRKKLIKRLSIGGQDKPRYWQKAQDKTRRYNSLSTWPHSIQKYYSALAISEVKPPFIIVFQGGDDGRVYRNRCKIPRGSHLKQGDWYILAEANSGSSTPTQTLVSSHCQPLCSNKPLKLKLILYF